MMYRQCNFKKGNTYQTAFIEDSKELKVGSVVELKSDNRQKWEVISVGENKHLPQLIHTWQM